MITDVNVVTLGRILNVFSPVRPLQSDDDGTGTSLKSFL